LRIAITTPTTWPYVRRGAERFVNELASYLTLAGHEVVVISAKPGSRESRMDEGYETLLYRRLWHPMLSQIGWLEFHSFFFTTLFALVCVPCDVVLCTTFMDALAATLAREFTHAPCAFVVNGLPTPVRYVRSLTARGAVFRQALRRSNVVIGMSEYVERYLRRRWGCDCVRIPVPVDTKKFRLNTRRDQARSVIACAATLDDPRKGGRVLMRAFNILRQRHENLRLQIAHPVSSRTQFALVSELAPRFRSSVDFLGATQNVADVFAQATLSVLPSLWEPYGMVVLESMATGTPVVGTRDGAIPELISNSELGCLFEPGTNCTCEPSNVMGLVEAIEKGLELSRSPRTAWACRQHAERFSWAALGPRFEKLLKNLVSR
jgi:phosphatidylinositol alpha-mannosyltransferase